MYRVESSEEHMFKVPPSKEWLLKFCGPALPPSPIAKNFNITERQLQKGTKWLEEHDPVCPFADPEKQGAIGGRISYVFTPTTIGEIVAISCACGAEYPLTELDDM